VISDFGYVGAGLFLASKAIVITEVGKIEGQHIKPGRRVRRTK